MALSAGHSKGGRIAGAVLEKGDWDVRCSQDSSNKAEWGWGGSTFRTTCRGIDIQGAGGRRIRGGGGRRGRGEGSWLLFSAQSRTYTMLNDLQLTLRSGGCTGGGGGQFQQVKSVSHLTGRRRCWLLRGYHVACCRRHLLRRVTSGSGGQVKS